jgi:two-component system, LytTR family, response regulator
MKTSRKKICKTFEYHPIPICSVHVGSRLEFYPSDIVMIEAEISYSYLYLSSGKKIIVSTNIQKLEERFLPFRNMVRVHRSTMINTQFLKSVNGAYACLDNNLRCVISRRKRIDLFNAIQINN